MSIKSIQGYVFYNELLYRCMRIKYGNMKINKQMQSNELRTQYKIHLKTLNTIVNEKEKITLEDVL